MTIHTILETVLIVIIGTVIMRIGGRKSISQTTIAQTVIIISIGKVLIEPVAKKDFGSNFLIAAVMIIVLLILEFLMLKVKFFEDFIGGKPVIVIEKGVVNQKNLKKLRMTISELEARFRQNGIKNFGDIDYATIDPNGELGYRWMPDKEPATYYDIKELETKLVHLEQLLLEKK